MGYRDRPQDPAMMLHITLTIPKECLIRNVAHKFILGLTDTTLRKEAIGRGALNGLPLREKTTPLGDSHSSLPRLFHLPRRQPPSPFRSRCSLPSLSITIPTISLCLWSQFHAPDCAAPIAVPVHGPSSLHASLQLPAAICRAAT